MKQYILLGAVVIIFLEMPNQNCASKMYTALPKNLLLALTLVLIIIMVLMNPTHAIIIIGLLVGFGFIWYNTCGTETEESEESEENFSIKDIFSKHDKEFSKHDKEFSKHNREFSEHDNEFSKHDKDFSEYPYPGAFNPDDCDNVTNYKSSNCGSCVDENSADERQDDERQDDERQDDERQDDEHQDDERQEHNECQENSNSDDIIPMVGMRKRRRNMQCCKSTSNDQYTKSCQRNDEYTVDGDDRIRLQSCSRNDQTRAIAGSMNRLRYLDPYLREEVRDEEARPWWGRYDN